MKIISVVRDFEMYDRLVRNNPFNKGADFSCFDNRQENLGIAARYNQFLNGYDFADEDWLIFCHEDWEVREAWQPLLERLDKNRLYGVAGIRSFRFGRSVYEQFAGCIRESQKDGSEQIVRGEPIFSSQEVDTFDCQCLIVHSCLIKEYNLRFDENLTFDLYGEELSIGARENYGIRSCVVPLACQHYSRGRLSQRFTDGIEYLNRKYAGAKRVYANVVSPSMLVYNRKKHKRLKPVMYRESFLNFLFSRKITRSGRMQIKICKLPVASIKMCK